MRISIDLDKEETELLPDTLDIHEDEGPTGAGWQSATLVKLARKIKVAVEKANATK